MESKMLLLYIEILNGSNNLAPWIFFKDESLGLFLKKCRRAFLKRLMVFMGVVWLSRGC